MSIPRLKCWLQGHQPPYSSNFKQCQTSVITFAVIGHNIGIGLLVAEIFTSDHHVIFAKGHGY